MNALVLVVMCRAHYYFPVYKAVDNGLGSFCVIKKLHDSQTDKKQIELFEREARILLELNDNRHVYIPRLLYFGKDGNEPFLVEEYIAGRTLEDSVFNEEQAKAFLIKMLPTLVVLHARDVIHRDIKPANVMMWQGNYFLIDFGVSAVKQPAHSQFRGRDPTIVFTYGFADADQYKGAATVRSDIYALAMTCYCLLDKGGISPSTIKDEVLKAVLEKMATQNGPARYSTAAEVLHDLKSIENPQPLSRKPFQFTLN